MMVSSATIKIFLVHGDPKRLRTAELSNWMGKAVAGPRSEFESILNRDESLNSGVYFLLGNDSDTGELSSYIGVADCIRDRLKSHLEKDFWNQVVFFVSQNEALTRGHILHLEGRLINLAKDAGRASIKNSQGSGSKLPESDRADMEVFLEKMLQLLPALGVEVLVPIASTPQDSVEKRLLTCEIKGLKAFGHLNPNGILVLKGSQAVLKERDSTVKYPFASNIRTRLMSDGALQESLGSLIFTGIRNLLLI